MKSLLSTFVFCGGVYFGLSAQIFFADGAEITVNQGGILHCNGGFSLDGSSMLTNHGTIRTTINSSLSNAGDFSIGIGCEVEGNGSYFIEQDWINDGNFQAGASTVTLYGDLEQFIRSNTNTPSNFNNLTLTGVGVDANRKKSMVGASASTSANGILTINDRELATGSYRFSVLNPALYAIQSDETFLDEGFVSSTFNQGTLLRVMNQADSYLFPVGSSDGIRRYRPVVITPDQATEERYEVTFFNYSASTTSYIVTQHESKIEVVNGLFYHYINKLTPNGTDQISIHYLTDEDGEWDNIAYWSYNDFMWYQIDNCIPAVENEFSSLTAHPWNLGINKEYYALVKSKSTITIPNVFSPNGDGVNDHYFITSSGLTDYQFTIINRWGDVVFKTDDPLDTWDGTYKGKPCTEGVYFYNLKGKLAGENIEKHGHITLVAN